jgi:hypothetical protein
MRATVKYVAHHRQSSIDDRHGEVRAVCRVRVRVCVCGRQRAAVNGPLVHALHRMARVAAGHCGLVQPAPQRHRRRRVLWHLRGVHWGTLRTASRAPATTGRGWRGSDGHQRGHDCGRACHGQGRTKRAGACYRRGLLRAVGCCLQVPNDLQEIAGRLGLCVSEQALLLVAELRA